MSDKRPQTIQLFLQQGEPRGIRIIAEAVDAIQPSKTAKRIGRLRQTIRKPSGT